MSSMRVTSIGELVAAGALEIGDGYRTKRAEHGRPGYRIIRVADVMDDAVRFDGLDFVSDKYANSIGGKAGQAGDVLLTTKGTVGRAAILPETGERVVYSPQLCYFRVLNTDAIVPRFLRYWFGSTEFWNQAANRMNNTDMAAYINLGDIRSLLVTLPVVSEQRAITDVLGALDDKIVANSRLITKIGEVLEATFALICGQSDATIPFNELATVTKGVAYRSADLRTSSTALVTLKSFHRNGGYSLRGLKDYAGPFKAAQQISPGELVVAQTDLTQAAEVVGRAVRVPGAPNYEKLVASSDLAIIRPRTNTPVEFLLGVMLQGRFRAHCRSRTSGTTVLHLGSDAIPSFPAPRVSSDQQKDYAAAARPLLELRDSLEYEAQSLGSTRDTLLPQLMSGKLRVKDAEKVLEGAGV
ncbi:type I restriction enzyme S subunit [Arthrobacter globiformis]|uniref:restriction endonuclease subunit S n=1 Tax=Arthrobacter globiformis TaxID=1665 RepID=UPI00277ECE68|nr:restriction endonuclease subunit S [Arthrobacter globiformis]MDQ1060762.1 type I restriction enzyme S subunit [Arthrobacter globiformis]